MLFAECDIAGAGAKARNARAFRLCYEDFATYVTRKGFTLFAYCLVPRWFFNQLATFDTQARRYIGIGESFCVKQFWMLCPELVISFGVAGLTDRNQIRWFVGIPDMLKKSIRYNVMTIKRLARALYVTMLANEVIPFKNGKRELRPLSTAIWRCSHSTTIAQSGENCK